MIEASVRKRTLQTASSGALEITGFQGVYSHLTQGTSLTLQSLKGLAFLPFLIGVFLCVC